MIVLSLYDYTGEAVKPWALAGYECHCYDIQHTDTTVEYSGGGSIHYKYADLHSDETMLELLSKYSTKDVVFGMAFPVCTDLAVSGSRHFAAKSKANPNFQTEAAGHAIICSNLFSELGVPFFVENPVSVLSTIWRKPNYIFNPCDFGGYISYADAKHPQWPQYIPPFDAYKKKTCLWTGGGFSMPTKVAVEPVAYQGDGYSPAIMKLGGKSQRTKNIRSATPRGFSIAVFEANRVDTLDRIGV